MGVVGVLLWEGMGTLPRKWDVCPFVSPSTSFLPSVSFQVDAVHVCSQNPFILASFNSETDWPLDCLWRWVVTLTTWLCVEVSSHIDYLIVCRGVQLSGLAHSLTFNTSSLDLEVHPLFHFSFQWIQSGTIITIQYKRILTPAICWGL